MKADEVRIGQALISKTEPRSPQRSTPETFWSGNSLAVRRRTRCLSSVRHPASTFRLIDSPAKIGG
jgi:hypothetical protein